MHNINLLGLFFLVILFLVVQVSATSYINIYLDNNGQALFLGKTSDINLSLPDTISITNGNIIGKTTFYSKKTGNDIFFNLSLNNSEINLILPSGALIKEVSSSEVYSKDNIISVYSKDIIALTYTIPNNNKIIYLFSVIIIIIFIVIIRKLIKNSHSKSNKKEILMKILNDRERSVINNLEKSGKIKMSYLRKLCDIPKASFSRHIQELEKKNLIKRTGQGKNKFVEIIN